MLSKISCLSYQNLKQFKTLLNHRSVAQKNCIKVLSTNRITFQQRTTPPDPDKSLANKHNVISTYTQKFKENPYVRLARLDKPIGKKTRNLTFDL